MSSSEIYVFVQLYRKNNPPWATTGGLKIQHHSVETQTRYRKIMTGSCFPPNKSGTEVWLLLQSVSTPNLPEPLEVNCKICKAHAK